MSATSYGRQKIVDDLTGVAPYSPPPLYLSAHTADPGVAGSHAHEVSAGGYARVPLAGVMGAADASGISVNTTVITLGPATADWGTITHFGIEDSLSSGNMLCPGAPTMPRTITTGQPLQIPVGQLRLRLT
ncbi:MULTISPECIES: phage tail fiber protein [unclassified Bradyrhizobium]